MPYERKNTTPEIVAIIGQTDNRTRQERQSDALQDLLARDNWSPDEARLILVGLDPEQSFSEREGHWWLPSASAEQLDLKDELEQDEIYDRLRRVDGVGITTGTPGDIIKRAFDAGIVIPWLQVALDDNKYQLPDDLRKHLVDSPRQKSLVDGFPSDQFCATVLDACRNILHGIIGRPQTA